MLELLRNFIGCINDFLYANILIYLLILVGLYYTFASGFVQFTRLKEGIKLLFEKSGSDGISGFQALMVSTASKVGVGNIAGVATAISIGGSGAIFWMWLMAILGGATACVECTMAQLYKVKNSDGEFEGGPSYYIEKIFKNRILSVIFSTSLIVTFAYGYEFLQANIITTTVERYAGQSRTIAFLTGIVMSALTAFAVFGGQKKIAKITQVLVPLMAGIYLIFCMIIILKNISVIPFVIKEIFKNAFDFKSFFAGFTGNAVMQGIKRGLYSNEAGMGSAPNAAATVSTSHPVKQGYVQMLSVYIDTLIICTATALMILSTGVKPGNMKALALVQEAVSTQFGEAGVVIVSLSVFMFAFSTIIGNYYYTEGNINYITKKSGDLKLFRLSIILAIFTGCIMDTSLAWNIADFTQAIMAIINLPVIFIFSKTFIKIKKDYDRKKNLGKDPVFIAEDIGIYDCDYWKKENLKEIESIL